MSSASKMITATPEDIKAWCQDGFIHQSARNWIVARDARNRLYEHLEYLTIPRGPLYLQTGAQQQSEIRSALAKVAEYTSEKNRLDYRSAAHLQPLRSLEFLCTELASLADISEDRVPQMASVNALKAVYHNFRSAGIRDVGEEEKVPTSYLERMREVNEQLRQEGQAPQGPISAVVHHAEGGDEGAPLPKGPVLPVAYPAAGNHASWANWWLLSLLKDGFNSAYARVARTK